MEKIVFLFVLVFSYVAAQSYKVCIPTNPIVCQALERDGSQVVCETVESKVDCAIKLARGTADIGVFSEEEVLLLAQHQPNDNRIVATIRDVNRLEPFAFEGVAVVPISHTGGLAGLRNGRYCHPGLDQADLRWSPRVLKTLEQLSARTDRCPDTNTDGKSAEELEIEILNSFFASGCRPGAWSANETVDANLKRQYPSLCSLCGDNANCSRYTFDMGVSVAGVNNNNRHIQTLECLRRNGTVAFVAWQHVREYFLYRNTDIATSYGILCEDETVRALNNDVLNNATAPCALVRQPWSAIVASTTRAASVLTDLRNWWPNGLNPGGNTWQSVLYGAVIGGSNAVVSFQDSLISPANYTSGVRNITSVDSAASCLPSRRWCTISALEQAKCSWVRNAAHVLGIQPSISCQQRTSVLQCLRDIREQSADFMAAESNYGYLARQHYRLTAVKLVQNSRIGFSRVTALVKATAAQQNITRFENLRGKKACFPEFGGIAYVTFVRTAHEVGVISATDCDYARSVGEFFDGACAPGAVDAAHALSDSSNFNASTLCTMCRPSAPSANNASDFICTYDYTNLYFGNNGSLACLADANTDVAFVETQNIVAQLASLNLPATQFRALCRNNTLAIDNGINIDDNCLLAHVVNSEVVARRNDPLFNALNVLFDNLDKYFGYNAASGTQLINLEIFSPFDGTSDLLFKDSAIGLSEPSSTASHEPARNYIELFRHLESCNAAAPSPTPGLASRNIYSILTLSFLMFVTRFIIY